MIDTILTLLGFGYDYISGVKQDEQVEHLFRKIDLMNHRIEKLGDNLYYSGQQCAILDLQRANNAIIQDMRLLRQQLEPIQNLLKNPMLATGMVTAPEQMKNVFRQNPWNVLLDIQPLYLASPNMKTDMIPILFQKSGSTYVGWQTKGIMPLLFNCEYNYKSGLWNDNKGISDVSVDYILDEYIGIETLGNEFSVLLDKGTVLPATFSSTFGNGIDWQRSVCLRILTNDSKTLYGAKTVNEISMPIPSMLKGQECITIAVSVDEKGEVSIASKVKGTGQYSMQKYKGIKVLRKGANLPNSSKCPVCFGAVSHEKTGIRNITCEYCGAQITFFNGVLHKYKECIRKK